MISTIGLRRKFLWCVVVAAVARPLLGLDFLQNFNICVNCAKCIICNSITNIYLKCNFLHIKSDVFKNSSCLFATFG